MTKEKKKGTSGNAKAFISRAKALKKLQLSLDEFRRLCILKGIYPRNPRKKLDGSDKTYYLRKDIEFLAHERLIVTIRAENAHKKKLTKARAKRRFDLLKNLARNAPRARLDHLIVERYPRFEDALRDLDDPLCLIALFANLPADLKVGISPARVSNCKRLFREFCHFVADTNALKKVFVSIKGYYFQASIAGETVTWITPHRFTQPLPNDVDFSVMLTFLQLYECMVSFVNFRLYTSRNYAYPPKMDREASRAGLELASLVIEALPESDQQNAAQPWGDADDSEKKRKVDDQVLKEAQHLVLDVEEQDEEGDDAEHDKPSDPDELTEAKQGEGDKKKDTSEFQSETADVMPAGVFAGKSFVLGREVPYIELEFVLKASGAHRVTREDNLEDRDGVLSSYTHWISDRPSIRERHMSLEYVQPQFVFDSINCGLLLPVSLYSPGAHLPPHLSPFVTDEDDGGYRPWYRDVLDRIKAGDSSVVKEAASAVYAAGEARKEKQSADAQVNLEELAERYASKEGGKPALSDVTGTSDAEEMPDQYEGSDEGLCAERPPGWLLRVPSAQRVVDEDDEHSESEEEPKEDSEHDSEGEEVKAAAEKDTSQTKEGKELKSMMMSRKKTRVYQKVLKKEKRKESVKRKLSERREQIDKEVQSAQKARKKCKRSVAMT